MAIVERSTTIDAPAERVFDYVADITRHPEWAGHKLEVVVKSQGPVQAGSTFETVGQHQLFIVEQRRSGTIGYDLPYIDNDHPGAKLLHHFQIVGGNQLGGG